MAFDWTEPDSRQETVRIPIGQDTQVEITKLVFGSARNGPFKTQSGDAQILLVMTDNQGRECSCYATLNEAAGWVLRSILSAANADLARMKADGVEITDFKDEDFARANLVGRRLAIRIKEYKDDAKGSACDMVALRRRPGQQPAVQAPPPPAPALLPPPAAEPSTDPADIPF